MCLWNGKSRVWALIVALLWCSSVMASSGGGEKKPKTDAQGKPLPADHVYVPIKPALVVHYGGLGMVRYLKADISLRMKDESAAEAVRYHMPMLRDQLIQLLSAQTAESLSAAGGKEALRQQALKEVRDILLHEETKEGVVDLYFDTLVQQN